MPYANPIKARECAARQERKPETIARRKRWDAANKQKRAEYTRRYRARHPEKVREVARNWKRKNPFQTAVTELIKGAKKSGAKIDKAYCRSLVPPATCPVFGTPIRFAVGEGFRSMFETASFDRVDNNYGYVAGNVQIISRLANTMKSQASPEQLRQFAAWIERVYGRL